jgi:Arc/MetJ family transcription regulator
MRTVVDINDEMLERARRLTGLKKKVDIVNYALEKLVEQREIEEILKLAGKVEWKGDLEEMRGDRVGSR